MSKPLFAGLLVAVVAVGMFAFTSSSKSQTVVVYKSPTCECCAKWITHMETAGFDIEVHNVNDLQPIKMQHGVQRQAQSCHTAIVDGYVIEGHVPPRFIKQMLEEKPAIKGLAVPGMPQGTPGMEGPNPVDYNVIALGEDGKYSVYARVEAGD